MANESAANAMAECSAIKPDPRADSSSAVGNDLIRMQRRIEELEAQVAERKPVADPVVGELPPFQVTDEDRTKVRASHREPLDHYAGKTYAEYAEAMACQERRLNVCQAALAEEKLRHQDTRDSRDSFHAAFDELTAQVSELTQALAEEKRMREEYESKGLYTVQDVYRVREMARAELARMKGEQDA